jgi:internalin A
MKTTILGAMLLSILACDESKYDKYMTAPEAATSAAALPTAIPSASAAPSATATWTKKQLSDCKPHPASVDFGDDKYLENEVRFKLGKDAGTLTPTDLAQVKSINLTKEIRAKVHQLDPCIYPMFTSLTGLFLAPGEYDDLTPIQKLTNLNGLSIAHSAVADLHAIEGLKRLDRVDLSNSLVNDEALKSVGSLVNVTELTLDGDPVSDLAPIANLKKLERLSIKKTQVKNLSPLAQLKTMKFLYIAETEISDITPVQPLISNGMKLINN